MINFLQKHYEYVSLCFKYQRRQCMTNKKLKLSVAIKDMLK